MLSNNNAGGKSIPSSRVPKGRERNVRGASFDFYRMQYLPEFDIWWLLIMSHCTATIVPGLLNTPFPVLIGELPALAMRLSSKANGLPAEANKPLPP